MLTNPQFRSDLSKVMLITLAYVMINLFFSFYNESLITSGYISEVSEAYDGDSIWIINLITGVLAGILGGTALVKVNGSYFRKKSFKYAMSSTFIAYILIYIIVLMCGTLISVHASYESKITFSIYLDGLKFFVFSKMAIVYFILWGVVTIFTLFFLQINDKFGPGMFLKFLAGKYYQPRAEDRIFMFLDLKSSTTIAEKIGNKKYFNLLNDVFTDITNSILKSSGQIYQYVGDEVVISWELSKGLDQTNCIKCFRRIKNKLSTRATYYKETYGINPEFKAGLHYGEVTAGEVGSIKRDIVYSGDVLNTTSRIQEQCNHYQVDFLVSTDLLNAMADNLPFKILPLGDIALRGKKKTIKLNTLIF